MIRRPNARNPGRPRWGMAAWLLALMMSSGPSLAASVYRCGPDQASYADRPCGPDAVALAAASTGSGQPPASGAGHARRSATATPEASARAAQGRGHDMPAGIAGIRHSPLGLDASQQLAQAGAAQKRPPLKHEAERGSASSRPRTTKPKDPRVTFEVKAPASPRGAQREKSTRRTQP